MRSRLEVPISSVAAGIAVAGMLVLAGCGGDDNTSTTDTVDTATVESQIKQQLSVSGAQVSGVDCPSDVKSETGATFTCSVTWSNGAAGKVKVTETSPNRYTYAPVNGSVQVPGASVEKTLEEQLAKEGFPNATANCPDNIIVKTGTTVTCDVSGAGATGTVTFTFSDAEGTVDPSSVKTGS